MVTGVIHAQVLRAGLDVRLTLAGPWCHADILEGRVVGVSDGDTITLLDAKEQTHKIRLSGIDAPEKDQAFGQNSKQHLSDAVFGKDIQVDHHKKDRYPARQTTSTALMYELRAWKVCNL